MRMTHVAAALIFSTLVTAASFAQTTPSRLQEPGQAEGQQNTRAVTLPTKWNHPDTEIRGVWVTRNDMELQKDETSAQRDQRLRDTVKKLHDANFNLLLIDTWFQGYVPYEGSSVAPAYKPFKGDDLVKLLIDAAHEHGMQTQAWLSYGFYAYFTPDASKDKSMGAILDKHPELLAINNEGNGKLHRSFGDYFSLCPSNPGSHGVLAQLMLEQVNRYAFDGVHLDRIRYPEDTFCFCGYCKEHFKHDTGLDLKDYPKGSDEARKLLQWRREQTATAVAHFRDVVQKAKPGLPMTAYVVGPFEMDSKAQGWDLWAQRGLVDAVGVSMYGADIRPAAEKALQLLGPAKDKLVCALSAEVKPSAVYLSNSEVAREYSKLGQFTWYLAPLSDDLQGLGQGPYAKPAKLPFAPKKD